MKQSLAELHERHPYDRDTRRWYGNGTLENAIAQAGDLHLEEDPLTYLDTIERTDYARSSEINRALNYLPPEVVIDNFGEEVGLWTSITSVLQGENDAMNQTLAEKHGYDITDLEISRGWVWRRRRGYSAKPVLAQYGLMQAMKTSALENVDLGSILQGAAKEGVELSDARIADYSLEPIEVEDYNTYYDGGSVKGWVTDEERAIAYDSWLDTPIGFTLKYRGIPNAMAGLAMNGLNEIMQHQIQGVRAVRIDPTKRRFSEERIVGKISSRGLAPLDWQKVLVDTTEHIARNTGMAKVGIQAAKNNVWIKIRMPRDTEPHLPIDKAVKAYDEPAERLGYYKEEADRDDNWHKAIV